jgi:hypothetical protein
MPDSEWHIFHFFFGFVGTQQGSIRTVGMLDNTVLKTSPNFEISEVSYITFFKLK